ncbi:hypothetical protein HMPREF0742_01302 [Rothia aeria F0184]|uniref:Uncharacterized protein n=1 Tax=Rothia aeria F0184 TaxID=888019 RepID=U7V536_9MICC|nr:hypothetical protein HMPREF0742_01302 [Rothia aeria F0184]
MPTYPKPNYFTSQVFTKVRVHIKNIPRNIRHTTYFYTTLHG